jgi:uncharacterized protein
MTITRAMFRESGNTVCDGYLLKRLAVGGVLWLERNKDRVNQLNVFPVPDGDTGTNMLLTMRGAWTAIANVEEQSVGALAKAFAKGALVNARGNSGVILSQIWAGAAKALEGHDKLTVPLLAQASIAAVDAAYNAVEKPVEGTILTVAREIKEAILLRAEHEKDLVAMLKTILYAGRASLRRTPDKLPLLKKAGVVDSGGQGLVFIFEGMLRALCGKDVSAPVASVQIAMSTPLAAAPVKDGENWEDALAPDDEEGYGFDVQFLMHGENMDVDKIRADIQAMGWSTLVVGDPSLIKVHVHVHNPGVPLSYAIESGADIDDIVVENMHRQYQDYVQARAEREGESGAASNVMGAPVEGVAVITVASGKGIQRIFTEEMGAAYVITGGQTMNPSTGDFLAAIDALPNEEIILLPNNKNVVLSAKHAAEQAPSGKRIRVVTSTTIPQGIAAMFEYHNAISSDPPASLEETANAMTDMLKQVVTGEITRATRDVEIDDLVVKQGQFIGLINDTLSVAGDDMIEVARALLHKADADRYERITLYYGDTATERDARKLADALAEEYDALDFEIVHGGQPLYPYMIAIE